MPPSLQAIIDLGFDPGKFSDQQLTVVRGLKEVYAEADKINNLKIAPGAANSWVELNSAQQKLDLAIAKTAEAKARAATADATAKIKAIQLENEVIKQINLEQQANEKATATIEKKNAAAAKSASVKVDDPTNADIPFTSNLAALEAEQNAVKQTGAVVNEFQQQELEAQLSATAWAEGIELQAAAAGTLDNELLGLNETVTENAVVTKEDAKIAADAANDYKQLSIAYTDAALRAKNYAAQLGINHPTTIAAANDAKEIGETLKNIDNSVVQNQRNVRNYGEAFSNAFSKATSATRVVGRVVSQLSRQVISLGTGFLSFAFGAKALELLGKGLQIIFDYAFPATEKFTTAWESLDKTLEKSNPTIAKVIENVDELRGNVDLAKKGFLDKNEVVKEYNDTMGKAAGQVKTLDEVEQKLTADGDAYIQMTIYKTAALGVLTEAATAAIAAQKSLMDDLALQDPNNAASKTVFGHQGATQTAAQLATQDIATQTVKAKKESDNYIKVYEELMKKAADLANQFHLQLNLDNGASDSGKLKKELDIDGELYRNFLQARLNYNEAIQKNDAIGLDVRLDALRQSYKIQEEILRSHLNTDLRLNKEAQADTADDLTRVKKGSIAEKNLQIDLKNEAGQRLVIEQTYQTNLAKLKRSAVEDAEKFQEAADKRLRIAQEGIVKAKIEDNAKSNEDIYKDETLSYTERSGALAQYSTDQSELIANDAIKQKADKNLTAREILAIDKEAALKQIELAKKTAQELSNIYVTSANAEAEQDKKGAEGGLAADELSLYKSLKNKADFAKKSQSLQNDEVQKEIDIDEAKQRDLLSSSATTDAAKFKAQTDLDKDFEEQDKLNLKKQTDAEKEADEKKKLQLNETKEFSLDAINEVQELEDAAFERRQRQLEAEVAAVKAAEEKKIADVNSSSLNAQQRAIELQEIQAQAAQQTAALERQEKANAIAKAKFDRDAGIAKVIINTAIAVTEAIPEGPAFVALAATAGAVELSAILATPIPSYAKGTKNHPGGPAIFGEAGNELIEEPGKKPYIAYEPTLGILAAGSKVTPMLTGNSMNDYLLHKAYQNIDVKPQQIINEKMLSDSIVEGIGKHLSKVTTAVKGQRQSAPIIKIDSGWNAYIQKSVRE